MSASRARTASLLCALLWIGAVDVASASTFRIEVDDLRPEPATKLCLAVEDGKPVGTPVGAVIDPGGAGEHFPMVSGTFYAVVLAECGALKQDAPATWTTTDTRELRVTVKGEQLCLSHRTPAGIRPLIEPFLGALGADRPGNPASHLAAEMKRERSGPDQSGGLPVLVGPCGRSDSSDFWIYDHLTETIAGPGHSFCLTTDSRPERFASPATVGTPAVLVRCGDLRGYTKDATSPRQRWTITDPARTWPTYRPPAPRTYFGGQAGLPIAGPMGRCLSAEPGRNIVTTSDCDNRIEQDWLFSGTAVQLGGTDRCLARLGARVLLRPCDGGDDQRWVYDNPDPMPNPRWRNADVYARIHPSDRPGDCMAVRDDPFVDPARQNNPVVTVPCGATKPRQVSWFVPDRVRTVRIALLRYANDDGSKPSNGPVSDDVLKARMVNFALRLSEHYRGLGVRFVFDPDADFVVLKDSVANEVKSTRPDGTVDWSSGNAGSLVAATTLYGRATVITMAGYQGGGSSGGMAEFEVARMINLITRGPETSYTIIPGLPRDRYGLPAVSMTVSEGFVSDTLGSMGHHAHEFGHYFGLGHTFGPDLFGDTPDDLPSGNPWLGLGTSVCGNPRGVTVRGRVVTPDRLNNEGYFGCQIGRTRNAFSPLQLGYMDWQLNHFLNRYPLVACQPVASYDGDHVECENAESLARCQDTARVLQGHYGVDLACSRGGRYARAMAAGLALPAFRYVFAQTEPGRAMIEKLSGSAGGSDTKFGTVTEALAACTNLSLTMAIVNRMDELRVTAIQSSPGLANTAFAPRRPTLSAADQRLLASVAGRIFTSAFIDNLPRLTHE